MIWVRALSVKGSITCAKCGAVAVFPVRQRALCIAVGDRATMVEPENLVVLHRCGVAKDFWCPMCGEAKTMDEVYIRHLRRDGRRTPMCRTCRTALVQRELS